MRGVTIYVSGDPAAQGSKRLVSTKSGRTIMLESSKRLRPWRSAVADAAREFRCPTFEGDVAMRVRVRFVRPQSHFRKDGTLRASAAARPGKADCDKLLRGICDALTGIAYHDDRQVASVAIERVWCSVGQESGATIHVCPCPADGGWVYEHS
jgi:crossover junction endodeoxyribonuclease RusA